MDMIIMMPAGDDAVIIEMDMVIRMTAGDAEDA